MPCVRFSCGDESFHAHGRWLLLGCDSRNIVYDHNTHYRILHIKTNLHDYRRLETSPFGNRERREETLNDLFQVFDQSFRDLAPSAPLRYWKDRSIARGSCNERAHYCDTFSVLSWTPSAPASGPVPEAATPCTYLFIHILRSAHRSYRRVDSSGACGDHMSFCRRLSF